MSLRSQVEKAVKEEGKRDWDPSVKSEYKMSTEDKVAARLAQEVLKDNSKLKGIHSNQSIQRILQKAAKEGLYGNNVEPYKGPIVSTIKDKEMLAGPHASNLPYLHKNPAI